MLNGREIVFPREEHTNWSAQKTYILKIYGMNNTQTHMQPQTPHIHTLQPSPPINLKRCHEFEREQGRIYRRATREKRGGRNDVMMQKKREFTRDLSLLIVISESLSKVF